MEFREIFTVFIGLILLFENLLPAIYTIKKKIISQCSKYTEKSGSVSENDSIS